MKRGLPASRLCADGRIMSDVLDLLRAVQPMPRGERMARRMGNGALPPRGVFPLWWRLFMRMTTPFSGQAIWACDDMYGTTILVRRAAAPLRKCREQRQGWRSMAKWWWLEAQR